MYILVFVIWTAALASKFDGRSKNISNQTILIATFLLNDKWKHPDIVFADFSILAKDKTFQSNIHLGLPL